MGLGTTERRIDKNTDATHTRRSRETIVVFAIAALVILASVPFRPDHIEGDEGFANAGVRALTHYIRGDFDDPYWRESDSFYGSPSPRIGPMILGAQELAARGIGFDAENQRVVALRVVYGLWSAVGVMLMFVLVRDVAKSSVAATCSVAAMLANPVFRSVQVAILPETPMIVFVTAALVFLHRTLRAVHRAEETRRCAAFFGLFAGLALGCKLYAVSLFIAFAWSLFWAHPPIRERPRLLGIAVAVAAMIFVVSNPLIWTDPVFAFQEMTFGHLRALGGVPGTIRADSLSYVATYPFVGIAMAPWPLNQYGGLPLPSGTALVVMTVCVALTVFGLYRAWRDGSTPLLSWAGASFLWTGLVVGTLTPGWIVPKVFLLPVLGLSPLWGIALAGMGELVFRRFRPTE